MEISRNGTPKPLVRNRMPNRHHLRLPPHNPRPPRSRHPRQNNEQLLNQPSIPNRCVEQDCRCVCVCGELEPGGEGEGEDLEDGVVFG